MSVISLTGNRAAEAGRFPVGPGLGAACSHSEATVPRIDVCDSHLAHTGHSVHTPDGIFLLL